MIWILRTNFTEKQVSPHVRMVMGNFKSSSYQSQTKASDWTQDTRKTQTSPGEIIYPSLVSIKPCSTFEYTANQVLGNESCGSLYPNVLILVVLSHRILINSSGLICTHCFQKLWVTIKMYYSIKYKDGQYASGEICGFFF